MKKKGSTIVATLGFIMVFTLLGTGTIYHAALQNEDAKKRYYSMEAFWLADGGIEKAKNRLQKSTPITISENDSPLSLGNGAYYVYSKPDPACPACIDRWLVHSEGIVKNQKRVIEVIMGKYDITNVLTTQGPIKDLENCPMASIEVDCSLVKENVDFYLEDIFKDLSYGELMSRASYIYDNPSNAGDVDPIGGVTVINLSGNNNSLSITTDNQTESSFVYIDTTMVTSNATPQINISGNGDFLGIIWIVGEAELKGTVTIRGSVFVESSSENETKVLGNVSLVYDADMIDQAVGEIGSLKTETVDVITWKEI